MSNSTGRGSVHLLMDRAALWRYAQVPALDVVNAAVQVLVDEAESPAIVAIACLVNAEAESELGDLLDDLGLRRWDTDTELIAAAALIREHLGDDSDPETLTDRIHRVFGHDGHPLVEALSELDDRFGTVGYTRDLSREVLAARTRTAARSLVAEADRAIDRLQQANL